MRVGQQSSWLVARLIVVRVGGARPRDRKPPAYCGPPHVVKRRWARIGYGRLPPLRQEPGEWLGEHRMGKPPVASEPDGTLTGHPWPRQRSKPVGIGVSILLMAAGAVMTFAVELENSEGFNINTMGIILMIAGAIGLVTSLIVFGPRSRRGTVVEERRDVI